MIRIIEEIANYKVEKNYQLDKLKVLEVDQVTTY